ncbi:ATP-binding protein [Flexibacterium corallicola]|uniref:hypothetical protein n=1 Tax=Flexibacterium corallicola TaxID=3037259 RepID=UPI00286F1C81|nr:hypothetical protein [Pseudovibrio sp. M1P-2-3]
MQSKIFIESGLRIHKANDPSIRYVQIYGERNSGTSFLSDILKDNMKEPRNFLGTRASDATPLGTKIFGYKHWFINQEKFKDPRSNETLFVVIYRNPYTWFRSMMEKPYALSQSISGRSVEELPGLKLAGHINGKDTLNEFHPNTGEKVDLFELRRLKIESFENLKNYVENIVFINMETLLSDPSSMMQALSQNYRTGFVPKLNQERVPPRALLRQYSKPEVFSPQEIRVLNENIHWNTEASIGYEKNNYFLPASDRLTFVILHGSSAVGKTYAIKRLQKERDGIISLEMDDCRYWDDYPPALEKNQVRAIVPNVTQQGYQDLMDLVLKVSVKAQRNIGYLLQQAHGMITETLTAPDNKIVVATCGALPFPTSRNKPSIYTWLEARLPIIFTHLLIDIPQEMHLSRMKERGRIHLKDEILQNSNKRQKVRENHDIMVSSYDEILAAVDALSCPS